MRVRTKQGTVGTAREFNTHALSEVIVGFEDGDMDSVFMKDLDVEVNGAWKDMRRAFADRDIVPNNYNTRFAPPADEDARERGWNW